MGCSFALNLGKVVSASVFGVYSDFFCSVVLPYGNALMLCLDLRCENWKGKISASGPMLYGRVLKHTARNC